MTDNFNRYKDFMRLPETEGGDAYYVIELVRRGKDNPGLPAANYHFKNYYIDTMEKYGKVQEEIRQLCRTLCLRAYVSVNRKSFRQVTMNTIAELGRRAALDDFRRPYAVFESCSGKYLDKDDRHWIVDIDNCSFGSQEGNSKRTEIIRIINGCEPEGDKIELVLPTRSGVHLVTRPFNLNRFHETCRMLSMKIEEIPDIQKNHITLLFEDLT